MTDERLSSGGEGGEHDSHSLELMEIPLSPTNYNQPPTPPDLPPPPSALEAELNIMTVLDKLKDVRLLALSHSIFYIDVGVLLSKLAGWFHTTPLL